jgi:hypothetical protein
VATAVASCLWFVLVIVGLGFVMVCRGGWWCHLSQPGTLTAAHAAHLMKAYMPAAALCGLKIPYMNRN